MVCQYGLWAPITCNFICHTSSHLLVIFQRCTSLVELPEVAAHTRLCSRKSLKKGPMINSLKICSNSPVISLTWWFLLALFCLWGSFKWLVQHLWQFCLLSSSGVTFGKLYFYRPTSCFLFVSLFCFFPPLFLFIIIISSSSSWIICFPYAFFSKMEIKLYIKFRMHNSYIRFGVTLSIFVSVVGK